MSHIGEIIGVLVTGLVNIVTYPNNYIWYILLSLVGWGGYTISRIKQDPTVLKQWGIRTRDANWGYALRMASVTLLICGAIGVGFGWIQIRQPTFWKQPLFWVLLVVYPLFGILQQFVVQSMLTRNLARHTRLGNGAIITVVTCLFALAHCYDLELMYPAIILGIVSTITYLHTHSILPIGIYHGIVAAVYYYAILGRDIKWFLNQIGGASLKM